MTIILTVLSIKAENLAVIVYLPYPAISPWTCISLSYQFSPEYILISFLVPPNISSSWHQRSFYKTWDTRAWVHFRFFNDNPFLASPFSHVE
jgi:hypothetical protein